MIIPKNGITKSLLDSLSNIDLYKFVKCNLELFYNQVEFHDKFTFDTEDFVGNTHHTMVRVIADNIKDEEGNRFKYIRKIDYSELHNRHAQ